MGTQPLQSRRFVSAVLESLAEARGSYIYDAAVRELHSKTSVDDSPGYVCWFRSLLRYLTQRYDLKGRRILDIGCGLGEFTVRMNLLSYQAFGVDIHGRTLELGQLLASENGLATVFIQIEDQTLPFSDGSFDIVTMIAVLEHMGDGVLDQLIPELRRVCRGVVYAHVPNKVKIVDDHTGLRFVPWMPRRLARQYVRARGAKYRYHISSSGTWDVHYRGFDEIVSAFGPAFDWEIPPNHVVWPNPTTEHSNTSVGKTIRIGDRRVRIALPIPWRVLKVRGGYPEEAYYSYLNLIFIPRGD